jgi:hypothetical protein
MGAGAIVILGVELIPLFRETRGSGPIRQAAAAVTMMWLFPALGLTPIAAIVTMLVSRTLRWAPRVVRVLWVVVLVSLSVVIPAAELALQNYVFFKPRPAEAPPVHK